MSNLKENLPLLAENWQNFRNSHKACTKFEILHWNFERRGSLGVDCSEKWGNWVKDLRKKGGLLTGRWYRPPHPLYQPVQNYGYTTAAALTRCANMISWKEVMNLPRSYICHLIDSNDNTLIIMIKLIFMHKLTNLPKRVWCAHWAQPKHDKLYINNWPLELIIISGCH